MADLESEPPPQKPPDKGKLEKEKQLLSIQIEDLAGQLRCLDTTVELGVRLLPLQAARAALQEQHRHTDEALRALAPRITEKRHEITKLRDRLKYRTEQQVDDAVQRLEHQIQTQNFRLREEEKIVREINELKKSKRTLRDYDAKKRELEVLSQRQRQLRHERDRLFGEMDKHKRDEERLQRDADATAASAHLLNTELVELRARRDSLDETYQRQQEAWKRATAEAASRRPPPPAPPPGQRPPPALQQQPAPPRPPPEPHREELAACAQLMAYLQRLSHTPGTTPATPSARLMSGGTTPLGSALPVSPATPLPGPPCSPSAAAAEEPTLYLLPRKEEATAPTTPARAKRRRDRRNAQRARPLVHPAETFHQFCLLAVTPPAAARDVPAALEQLKAKQKYYQMSTLKAQQEGVVSRPSATRGAGPSDLTLRLSAPPVGDPAPRPQLVTMHSIGVQLPYQLTMAPPTAPHPPEVTWPAPPPRPEVTWPARPPVPCSTAVAVVSAANPASSHGSSRDSGVPSAPLSAEVAADPEHDPFAAALQSRLSAEGGAAQRQSVALEVPAVTQ